MDIKKLYKKNKLISFCKEYNVTKKDVIENNHNYFRYVCYNYIDFIKHIELPYLKKKNIYESVLIEFRNLPHIEFIIRNNILKLGTDWCHTVVCGNLNFDMIHSICSSISPNINVVKIDIDNMIPNDYNKFLTTIEFWKSLYGEKILIYQEDSLIFKNNINDFIHFDYIGAPFPKFQNDTPNLVGNGGLSLRSKESMIEVLNTISIQDTMFNSSTIDYMSVNKLQIPPEDVYFSKNMQDYKIGEVADYESASYFSSESIFNPDSFGGHKFWISNNKWSDFMKNLFNYSIYKYNSDLNQYLKYNNLSVNYNKNSVIKNAFDVDLHFCNVINNLHINNSIDIMKYIKLIGINGFIYHPKQILNIFPNIAFFSFLNNIFIMHKLTIYSGQTFVNKFLYNSSFEELQSTIIKKKYSTLNSEVPLLVTVFIGNEEKGIDLIYKIINYKKIQLFNVAFCFNVNVIISDEVKTLIKNNFSFYAIYCCKELGTDITPTVLMYEDIIKTMNFTHVIKLHTKSIQKDYLDLTNFLLTRPLIQIVNAKLPNCNCVGHPDYYIELPDDIFNNEIKLQYLNHVKIRNYFVGGTIFYCPGKVFTTVVNFMKQNNYRSYILNNLYENNSINKDFSPIHYLERLFGIIKCDVE